MKSRTRGGRKAVGKILAHIGLIPKGTSEKLRDVVDSLIADPCGRFHFGSLVRCTVEQLDKKTNQWNGSGGGMLDKFVATPFGDEIAGSCVTQFLSDLPSSTRLVVMFGLGTRGNYISAARALIQRARGGAWRTVNDVAYTD